MILKIDATQLIPLLHKQLANFFFIDSQEVASLNHHLPTVLNLLQHNFSHSQNKYYSKVTDSGSDTYFNPYHAAQYCIYLYYFSHVISQNDKSLADKLYYLNKIMNACDLYHEVKLPAIFSLDHPVGSVMGRAVYGDYFQFGQNCTVGNNKGIYPVIGQHVKMSANSAILGNCHIGDNVTLGAGCIVKDTDIPSHVLVFGQSPYLIIKEKK